MNFFTKFYFSRGPVFQNLVQLDFIHMALHDAPVYMHRRLERRAVLIYELLKNHFCHAVTISFYGDFHSYYTRSTNNIRTFTTSRT